MFTGLIEDVGELERISAAGMTDLWIRPGFAVNELSLGESVACDGVCLTVVEIAARSFRVQASAETLRRSTIDAWQVGKRINLERALRVGDRLGGHWVLGHVDAVSSVVERRAEGAALLMGFSLPPELAPFFIEKGSVAIDGISLTLNELSTDRFSVALIPETQVRTTLADKPIGAKVNLEADVIGKYVARLYGLRAGSGISEETLRRAGFSES